MNTYLFFRLYSPLCSWGDIAVGEVRPSFTHPSRSAIVGLIAAALGIKRDEEEKLESLGKSFLFSVLAESLGNPLSDYHTIQVPPSKSGRTELKYYSRLDELNFLPKYELNTILSYRDYRCDAVYTVVLQGNNSVDYTFGQIKDALMEPKFHLYLGRKSCPLAMPLEPQIIVAVSVRDALEQIHFIEIELQVPDTKEFYWENGINSGIKETEIFERRDMPLSRKRWQFDVRKEYYAQLQPGG